MPHLPDWLYEAKPALYAAAGIAFASAVPNPLGRASGVLLLAAGVVIHTVRRHHRARRAQAELSRLSTFDAPPSRLAATTAFVRTVAPPRLGHADIDRQHRSLATQCATLHVAFEHGDTPADLELLLEELVDALERHLEAEETALQRLGVERAARVRSADIAALADARRTLAGLRGGTLELEAAIGSVTQSVAVHLKGDHPPLPSMEATLARLRAATPA